MHGKGTRTWMTGEKYVGEFQNGVCCGKGKLIYPSGDNYDGEF